MPLIDIGSGPLIILVPGIQGRWEYLEPCIAALSRSFRVLTFPLRGEHGADALFDNAAGIESYARQIEAALDAVGAERAAICGISFGGLAAVRFAATRPDRTTAIVLASTPGPHWHLRGRHQVYARAPWFFGPLFLAESPFRLHRELAATFPNLAARWRFARWQLKALLRAPLSPNRMATRAALIPGDRLSDDCSRVTSPVLVITGERDLDRVVPVRSTIELQSLIPGAQHQTLRRTGHLGTITRPDTFAELVRTFLERRTLTRAVDDVA